MVQRPTTGPELITGPQLAELVGEPYSTVDYWSRVGLLQFSRRGSTRLYAADAAADRCRRIRRLQNEGFTIMIIKQDLTMTPAPTAEPTWSITPEQLAMLEAKLDVLTDRMQTPEAREATARWFHTPPSEYNRMVAAAESAEDPA